MKILKNLNVFLFKEKDKLKNKKRYLKKNLNKNKFLYFK